MEQTGHISPVFVDSTGRRRRRLRRVAYLFGTVSLVYTGLVSASFSSGPGSPFGLPPLPDLLDRPDRAPSTAPRERPVAAPAGESPIGVWVEARNAGPRSTDRGGAPVRPAGPAGALSTPGPLAVGGELGSAGGPPVPASTPESTQAPQASASPRPEGDPAPAPEPASPQPTAPSDPSPQPEGDPAPASTPAEPSAGGSGSPESASADTSRAGRPSPRPAGRAGAQRS